MLQLSMLQIEENQTILGCPIVKRYWHDILKIWIEVVGGRFVGKEFIYLIHLDLVLSRIQHYLGSTNDIIRRNREHQRIYPLFRFTDQFYREALGYGINQQVVEALEPLRRRTFRRYRTIEKAIRQTAGKDALGLYKFTILKATRRHTTNGILMAANQRGIAWRMVRVFQADRSLEQALKKRKRSFRLICPACQGIEEPF